MPSLQISFSSIVPELGLSKPAIILSKVLFPQPENPIIVTISPSLISRLMSSKSFKSPKDLERFFILTIVLSEVSILIIQ